MAYIDHLRTASGARGTAHEPPVALSREMSQLKATAHDGDTQVTIMYAKTTGPTVIHKDASSTHMVRIYNNRPNYSATKIVGDDVVEAPVTMDRRRLRALAEVIRPVHNKWAESSRWLTNTKPRRQARPPADAYMRAMARQALAVVRS